MSVLSNMPCCRDPARITLLSSPVKAAADLKQDLLHLRTTPDRHGPSLKPSLTPKPASGRIFASRHEPILPLTCKRSVAATRSASQRSASSHVNGDEAAVAAAARSARSRLGVCARVSASARAANSSGLRGYRSRPWQHSGNESCCFAWPACRASVRASRLLQEAARRHSSNNMLRW